MNILFVCRGNVGRSQMAEVLFKKYIKGDYEVLSAGTKLSGPEQPIGELGPILDNMITVMKEEDVDVSGNIRNQLTPEMVSWADKIFMITDENDPVPNYLGESEKVIHWELPDVKNTSLEFHREVKDKIKKLILESDF